MLVLIGLAGCAGKRSLLKPIKKEKAHFVEQKDNIELRIRALTPRHCQKHFDSTPQHKRLHKDPVILQCTIINNSTNKITFAHNNTTLSLLNQQEIYQLLKKRGAILKVFATGLVMVSLPFIALGAIGCASLIAPTASSHGFTLVFWLSFLATWYGTIPVVAASVPTFFVMEAHNNQEISQTINKKVPEKLTVNTHKSQNFLLFTHTLPEAFTMHFDCEQEKPIIFNVNMPCQVCPNKKLSKTVLINKNK